MQGTPCAFRCRLGKVVPQIRCLSYNQTITPQLIRQTCHGKKQRRRNVARYSERIVASRTPVFHPDESPLSQESARQMHAENRKRIFSAMGDSIIVIEGASEVPRNGIDVAYRFRQDSNMYWATGVEEPDFHAVLDGRTQKYILVAPEYNQSLAIWVGHVPTLEEIGERYGADEVVTSLDKALKTLLKSRLPGDPLHVSRAVGSRRVPYSLRAVSKAQVSEEEIKEALRTMRETKSDLEVQCLAHANRVTSDAHTVVMQHVRDGMAEYQLEAVFRRETMHHGLVDLGYPVIVGSGKNAAVLHYGAGSRRAKEGELVLVDGGAEYRCFTADITRTFPVSGRFEGASRDVYQAVLDMQELALSVVEPGASWGDINDDVRVLLLERLKDMGAVRGSLEELLDAGVDKLFLPHNVGHFLGLDVHDMSGTGPVPVVLQERHVVTVEPGLYLIPALLLPALEDEGVKGLLDDKVVRSMMHVGGVRIEDNVVVTGDGICNLTSAPKTIAEIEALRE